VSGLESLFGSPSECAVEQRDQIGMRGGELRADLTGISVEDAMHGVSAVVGRERMRSRQAFHERDGESPEVEGG
jgi:hypothetical protein